MLSRFVLACALIAALTGPALVTSVLAEEAYVVNKAQDLRFINLREAFTQVRSRIEGQVDLMDRLRRGAFKAISDDWGIPPADKKDVFLGCVARTDDNAKLWYAIVLKGDIDPARIQAKLLQTNEKAVKRRGGTLSQTPVTVQGHAAMRWPYLEHNMEFTSIPLEKMFVLVANPKGDGSLIEEVLTALKDPAKLGQAPLGPVVVAGHMQLSDTERKRVQEFQARAIASPVQKVREKFKQLNEKLRPGGAQEKDLKSVDEQITDYFLGAADFELRLIYQPGATDLYKAKYVVYFTAPENAQGMRDLMLEKAAFWRENAVNKGIPRALDTVTVDAQGKNVVLRVELDTPEKRYDAAFSYVAFMLSMAGADTALGIMRGPQ